MAESLPELLMGPIGLASERMPWLGSDPSFAFLIGMLATTFFWSLFVLTLVGTIVAPANVKQQPVDEDCSDD
ncbi:MAG: hypothetical protein R3249_11560, partial [Nitriliruptorales bacterium]|nr:hypothetical protein [Nitriliruptorales bacterium]